MPVRRVVALIARFFSPLLRSGRGDQGGRARGHTKPGYLDVSITPSPLIPPPSRRRGEIFSHIEHSCDNGESVQQKILVIKLGAFGDFIQALGPMAAIRRHHPKAQITLLTTAPFVALAKACGYFNDVIIDTRPDWNDIKAVTAFRRTLRHEKFTRVYDLQNNDRTALYLWLFGLTKASRPEWIGAARGASHRNASPARIAGHAFEGHQQTLALAGIHDVSIDRLDWAQGDIAQFALPQPYILLVPGSAPNRPEKRWPVESYAMLAQRLGALGYTPVVVGSKTENDLGSAITNTAPAAINLCGRTAILDLPELARNAAGVIGNDTGPMHLIAATGCPTLVLFSGHSDPVRHGARGDRVQTLQKQNLADLNVDDVMKRIESGFFRRA